MIRMFTEKYRSAMKERIMIAMIGSAGLSLLIMALYGQRALPSDLCAIDGVAVAIFLAAFVALRKWKPNPIYVMAGSGVLGVILYAIS